MRVIPSSTSSSQLPIFQAKTTKNNTAADYLSRLEIELKGKIEAVSENTNDHEELVQALLALGYSEKEVRSTVSTIEYKLTIQEKIKKALKLLSG